MPKTGDTKRHTAASHIKRAYLCKTRGAQKNNNTMTEAHSCKITKHTGINNSTKPGKSITESKDKIRRFYAKQKAHYINAQQNVKNTSQKKHMWANWIINTAHKGKAVFIVWLAGLRVVVEITRENTTRTATWYRAETKLS